MSVAQRTAYSPTAAAPAASRLPDPTVRTIVSFLLFVHFFALAVAVFSNGAPEAPALARQVRAVPAIVPYLQLFDMDLNYRFHLTHGEVFDVDHTLEIDVPDADGETETLILPPADVVSAVRRQRYQRLGLGVATRIGNEQTEPVLPQGLAGAVMAGRGVSKATLRCRGHYLLTAEEATSPDLEVRDPNAPRRYRVIYEAQVVRSDDGTVSLVKTSSDDVLFGDGSSSSAPRETAPPPSTTPSSP